MALDITSRKYSYGVAPLLLHTMPVSKVPCSYELTTAPQSGVFTVAVMPTFARFCLMMLAAEIQSEEAEPTEMSSVKSLPFFSFRLPPLSLYPASSRALAAASVSYFVQVQDAARSLSRHLSYVRARPVQSAGSA